jgi:metallo-beta-lactamase family protein
MKITPIGAAGEVTGSCFLVETRQLRLVIDCGVFQGHHDEDEARNRRFPFDPSGIDAFLLTHAHLDHCGRLPLLHVQGFRGPCYATAATADLAQFIMLDSAKLQTEDYERKLRKQRRAGMMHVPPPLYVEQDVLHLLRTFKAQPYETPLDLGGGVQAVFHQSGHILGSAAIELREGDTRVLFSGDLGSPQRNVVPDPAPAPSCDLIFCESTYGDRLHRSAAESVAELKEAVNWAHAQGGNVVIPSFALERTQDIIFTLRELRDRGEAPINPVFVDSPLACNITRVYEHHTDDLDDETRAVLKKHEDPFHFTGLRDCMTSEQSKALNGQNDIIIIAGSGMCNGGRVVHHLKHNLWREDSAIVFVGFQAHGTLGRRLVDGAKEVEIDHEPITVKARTFTINGFSAHADQAALEGWLTTSRPAHIVLNHGEPASSQVLADRLAATGRSVEVAKQGVVYDTERLPVLR